VEALEVNWHRRRYRRAGRRGDRRGGAGHFRPFGRHAAFALAPGLLAIRSGA